MERRTCGVCNGYASGRQAVDAGLNSIKKRKRTCCIIHLHSYLSDITWMPRGASCDACHIPTHLSHLSGACWGRQEGGGKGRRYALKVGRRRREEGEEGSRTVNNFAAGRKSHGNDGKQRMAANAHHMHCALQHLCAGIATAW